jgi:hypothetical protein
MAWVSHGGVHTKHAAETNELHMTTDLLASSSTLNLSISQAMGPDGRATSNQQVGCVQFLQPM